MKSDLTGYSSIAATSVDSLVGVICLLYASVNPTHETAPFFLYNATKTATHSLAGLLVYCLMKSFQTGGEHCKQNYPFNLGFLE